MSTTGIKFRHCETGRVCVLTQEEPRRFAWRVAECVGGRGAVGEICAEWHNTDEGRVINGSAA